MQGETLTAVGRVKILKLLARSPNVLQSVISHSTTPTHLRLLHASELTCSLGTHRKSQSPVRPSHETSKARDDSHRPKDEPHRHRDRDRDRDREKEKDRHRATSHHRERVRSRSRAASRDRGRDVRLAERSHRCQSTPKLVLQV